MKKSFIAFLFGWLASIGLFNVVAFVTPNEINGQSKFCTLFWVAYAFITVCFIAQLVCVYLATRADSMQKAFYSLSTIQVSSITLVSMLIVGGVCMAVIQIPDWIGIIVCAIALAVGVWSYAKVAIGVGAVAAIDKKVKVKTMYIKMLTADADTLQTVAASPEMKELTRKVYEMVRYSDPMSDAALADVEGRITEAFEAFRTAVGEDKLEEAEAGVKKLNTLITERNTKCKFLK